MSKTRMELGSAVRHLYRELARQLTEDGIYVRGEGDRFTPGSYTSRLQITFSGLQPSSMQYQEESLPLRGENPRTKKSRIVHFERQRDSTKLESAPVPEMLYPLTPHSKRMYLSVRTEPEKNNEQLVKRALSRILNMIPGLDLEQDDRLNNEYTN